MDKLKSAVIAVALLLLLLPGCERKARPARLACRKGLVGGGTSRPDLQLDQSLRPVCT